MKKIDTKTDSLPNREHHTMCLPFEREEKYKECITNPALYREYLLMEYKKRPELFPVGFEQGWEFHSNYKLSKQQLTLKRIRIKTTKEVFTIRPSFVMPYGVGRTDEVEKALYLRQYGVPFEALAYVFGRDANYWERTWLALGRSSIVGTTVKDFTKLPKNLVADEKITWHNGKEVLLATTVGGSCFLGVGLAKNETAQSLAQAYGEFKTEAQQLDANYQPQTVCSDGFKPTRLAWQMLFPNLVMILCFLHGVLKVMERCRGQLRTQILDKLWHCYDSPTASHFSQRLRRVAQWAKTNLTGSVQEMVLKLHRNRTHYLTFYSHPQAHRTTNAVDRLMNFQDRLLYSMRYLHGSDLCAHLAVRSMALQWNFHPFSDRLRREHPSRYSPFADLNGFQYHPNWLHNLLIAASLGTYFTSPHKIRGD